MAGEIYVSNSTLEEVRIYAPKGIRGLDPEELDARTTDPIFDVDQWGNLRLIGVTIAGIPFRLPSPQILGRSKAAIEQYEREGRERDERSRVEQERKEAILAQLDTPGRVATIVTGTLAHGRLVKRALRRAARDGYLDENIWSYEAQTFTAAVCSTVRSLCPEIDWELYYYELPETLREGIVTEVAKNPARFSH